MAINILTANTFRGAFSGIAKIIKSNNSDKLKDKHIIIAPDRFTLTLEKLILEELGLSCAVNIEVVSFSRLAVKILKDDVKKFLSPQGAIMLMQKAAMNLNDNFKLYSACANKDGFAKQVFAVVSEIRNSNITSDELKNTVKNLKGKTKSKIEDLAKIYEEYLSLLNENYVDTTSRLNALSKIIPESSYLATANVYVTDFYSFNAVEMKLIELLAENSLNFTIALLNKNKGRNIRIYPTDTYNKVLNVLNNSGNKIEMIFCEEFLKEPFSAIEENLFGYSDKKVQSSDRVHINYAGDAYEEVLFIANKINEGLLGGGRFKDNAIVCSDIKKYQSILQEVFQRMDIPYFIDKKFPLKNVTQIKFILDGLECFPS